MNLSYEEQIYGAIAAAESRDAMWKVVRVLVTPETWQAIAANLSTYSRMRPNHFHLDDASPLPVTEIRIRDVPVIADAHAGPGFTLEQAHTIRFRA